jgi:hypothetical protein
VEYTQEEVWTTQVNMMSACLLDYGSKTGMLICNCGCEFTAVHRNAEAKQALLHCSIDKQDNVDISKFDGRLLGKIY